MTKKAKIGLLICGIVLGIGLFVANVLLAVKFPNCGSNIFAAISGWVSGIATLIVGLIAYWQSSRFSRVSSKQSLLNQITSYISEFQMSFINYIRIEKVIDLNHEIHNLSQEDYKNALKINDNIIELISSFSKFEAILLKGNYCADKHIKLHKLLEELAKELANIKIAEIEARSQVVEECSKRSKYLNEWIFKTYKLVNSILLEYHDLQLNIIKSENVNYLLQKTNEETQAIIDYFKRYAKEHNNG